MISDIIDNGILNDEIKTNGISDKKSLNTAKIELITGLEKPLSTRIESIIEERKMRRVKEQIISTGMKFIDKHLPKESSYICVVAGAPGSGKTTLVENIALSMAKQGTSVYYFTLDMTEEQIIGDIIKCKVHEILYRHSKLNRMKADFKDDFYNRLNELNSTEQEVFSMAMTELKQNELKNLFVIKNSGLLSMEVITQYAEYISEQNKQAVFIIDYLQLVPVNIDVVDKQKVDYAVQLAHKVKNSGVSLILISSVSKAFYSSNDESKSNQSKIALNVSCCKESGELEYSADVLLGVEKCRANFGDAISVTALKSRCSRSYERCTYTTDFAYRRVIKEADSL